MLAIDSPSGYTKEAVEYVCQEYRKLGYEPTVTIKGGVLVELGPTDDKDAVLMEAHLDTLGAMVSEIKGNGRLKLTPLGGMNPNNAEAENLRVITRSGRKIEGTFQLADASVHVNDDYSDTKRTYKDMEVVLDEVVKNKDDVLALGIMPGDIVAFEPRTRITESGYIKSRFLDEKFTTTLRYTKKWDMVLAERCLRMWPRFFAWIWAA